MSAKLLRHSQMCSTSGERRTIGVLIWGIAVFVVCEWARSFASFDSLYILGFEFISLDGYIWLVSWAPKAGHQPTSKTVELLSHEYGKELLRLKVMPSGEHLMVRVPHALIAIPLAALSLYLLICRMPKPVLPPTEKPKGSGLIEFKTHHNNES